jgi:hypothetical protein
VIIKQWLIFWLVVTFGLIVFLSVRKRSTVGLTASYLYSLTLNHFFGAAIFGLPWYEHDNADFVYSGFILTCYGLGGFALGVILVSPLLVSMSRPAWDKMGSYLPNKRLPVAYIATGFVLNFVLAPALKNVPSVSVIAYSGWSLMIVGICLAAWSAWTTRRPILRWILLGFAFPLFTTLEQGFLGYGVAALIVILLFVSIFYRPKWKVVIAAFVSIYLGLSFFVTYFRDREIIREAVWYERQSIGQRVARLANLFTTFEFLDFQNEQHLDYINGRLNQNYLVGKAVTHLSFGMEKFARGETIVNALAAFVPRVLWPGKPYTAGSGAYVSQYTGEEFAEGTSVGMGQVLEFYINFGVTGVVVGFFLFGALTGFIDHAAAYRLSKGDWQGMVLWLLPGLTLLQSGGCLAEVTASMAAALILAVGVNKYVLNRLSGRRLTQRLLRFLRAGRV